MRLKNDNRRILVEMNELCNRWKWCSRSLLNLSEERSYEITVRSGMMVKVFVKANQNISESFEKAESTKNSLIG